MASRKGIYAALLAGPLIYLGATLSHLFKGTPECMPEVRNPKFSVEEVTEEVSPSLQSNVS
jgi:hypothetical protein